MMRAATRLIQFLVPALLVLLCGLLLIERHSRIGSDEIRELEERIRGVEMRQADQAGNWRGWRTESRTEHNRLNNEDARLWHYHAAPLPELD